MENEIDDIVIDESLFDPYNMTEGQLETIRKIARVIMDDQKCDYTKATIIAYLEWLVMAEVEKIQH